MKILSCEFNIDTACVEVKLIDVRLLLSGKMEEYLRNNTDYTPLSDMR